MTIGVKHALVDEDPIGQGELVQGGLINVGQQRCGRLRARVNSNRCQCLDNRRFFMMHPPVHCAQRDLRNGGDLADAIKL